MEHQPKPEINAMVQSFALQVGQAMIERYVREQNQRLAVERARELLAMDMGDAMQLGLLDELEKFIAFNQPLED
ncbi:MAG TPA: hypothetical protein VG992_04310 [Candidatus Saccharimonadales bacterium]|nr:hypothetical protein [Candidatus Saccharimonadales bacterium]